MLIWNQRHCHANDPSNATLVYLVTTVLSVTLCAITVTLPRAGQHHHHHQSDEINVVHRRNFTLKSGGDQWHRQNLVSGGTTIEATKARASTRQRRRVGSGMGRGVPSPAD